MFLLTPCGVSYATLTHDTTNECWIFSLGSVVIHTANFSCTFSNDLSRFSSSIRMGSELRWIFFKTTHFGCLHSSCSESTSLRSSPTAISIQFSWVICLANILSSSDGSDPMDVIIITGSVFSPTNLDRLNVDGDKSVNSKRTKHIYCIRNFHCKIKAS